MKKKYKVKVGEEWDLEFEVESDEDSKPDSLKNWKSLTVLAIFVTVVVSGGYAAKTHDFTLYDKLLQALVSVANAKVEGTSNENAAKTECQSENHKGAAGASREIDGATDVSKGKN